MYDKGPWRRPIKKLGVSSAWRYHEMHPVLSSYRVPNVAKLTVYGLIFQREVKPTIRVKKKKFMCCRSESIRVDPT